MKRYSVKAVSLAATICCLFPAHARDYFVDSFSTAIGTPDGSFDRPYKKIVDVNKDWAKDTRILFKCGSRWPGAGEAFTPLELRSGVTYDSYTGPNSTDVTVGCTTPSKPVLTGAVTLKNLTWSNTYKSNIWRAELPVTTQFPRGAVITQLIDQSANTDNLDNVRNMVRARFPNIGDGNYPLAPQSRFLHIDSQSTPKTPTNSKGEPLSSTVSMYMDPSPGSRNVIPPSTNLVGAQAYVHSYDWFMASYTVTGHQPATAPLALSITLNDPGRQYSLPIKLNDNSQTGGYWLENQLWMLDAKGEWFFGYDPLDATADKNKRYLYVRRPDDSRPAPNTVFLASIGSYGITGGMRAGKALDSAAAINFTVRNLKLEDFALDGMSILGTLGSPSTLNAFTIDGVDVTRSGRYGISVRSADASAVAAASRPTIKNSRIDATAADGITLKAASVPNTAGNNQAMAGASGINILSNKIENAGMGGFALAAIAAGPYAAIKNNVVKNSASRGIDFDVNSYVQFNSVTSSCLEFNDCSAYYTVNNKSSSPTSTNDSTVTRNHAGIVGGPANLDGRHPDSGDFAVGIYVDDFASQVVVWANTVTGTDYGIDIHGGSNNTVSGNLVTDSRQAALVLGPSGSGVNYREPANNTVSNNVFVSALSSKTPLIAHLSNAPSTTGFASYEDNHYASLNSRPFFESTASGVNGALVNKWMNFNGWKLSGRDANASLPSTLDLSVQGYAPDAGNMISNGDFAADESGWLKGLDNTIVTWSNGSTQACPSTGGGCLAFSKGANGPVVYPYTQVLTSGTPINVQAGKVYMLSFYARAETNGTTLGIRMGDMGNYAGLSRWGESVTLSNTWRKYYLPLEALASSTSSGARLEWYGYDVSGNRIFLDNVRLLEPSANPEPRPIFALINDTALPQTLYCRAINLANCDAYLNVQDHSPAAFNASRAISMSAFKGAAYILKGSDWQDDDGDGVPNKYDACKNSGPTDIVDTTGCPY